jgi:hypothetical protein
MPASSGIKDPAALIDPREASGDSPLDQSPDHHLLRARV